MGSALTCPSSNRHELGSKLHPCDTGHDKSCPGLENVNYDIAENMVKAVPSNVTALTVTDLSDLKVEELGITLANVMNICDSHECYPGSESSGDQDESSDQNESKEAGVNTSSTTICFPEVQCDNDSTNESDGCSDENTSTTTICFAEVQSDNDSTNESDGCSDENELKAVAPQTDALQDFCATENPKPLDEVQLFPSALDEGGPCMPMNAENSIELATPKLVSALKGSRAQQGLPATKLSVKWAPDVYDPPVTSESHTVKGYRHHRKSAKKVYSKHRNDKSKSPRSGCSEKKHASRRSSNSANPRSFRDGAGNGLKVDNSSSLPMIPGLDYMSPELKCGASFYIGSLSRSHYSVAEAS